MPKKILVTGGAGFLGSHLCLNLIKSGHEVFCLDNFYTGNQQNIRYLLKFDTFKLLNQDIAAPLDLEIDEIYNLACPASPTHYQKNPVETIKTSVLGAINIHPQTEDYWGYVNPIGIRSCYDEGKRCAETLFFDYHRQLATKIKIARIFNTYGPNMQINDGRVVSNFIVQALTNSPITIYGNGLQTRSFCYVDDLIDGLIRLMQSDDSVTGPVNIGNPIEFTMLELAHTIIRMTQSKSDLQYEKLPRDDPKQRKPNISLANKLLDWNPKVQLEEGLSRTIPYFRDLLKIYF
jgi:UDP-glucuronate decarboxylase